MIKFIIFDLSEVLFKGILETGLSLVKKYNVGGKVDLRSQLSLESFPNIHHPLLIPLVNDFFLGKVSEDDYICEVIKTYPELDNKDSIKKQIRDNFTEIQGTRDIILKLKTLGYKIGLLSVHGREWIEYCEQKFDFHKMFDAVAYSYEDKVSKPDKQAFINIMQKLEAKPEDCIFIDDSKTNIQASEELGMKGIVFTSADNLEKTLSELLPNFKN